MGKSIFDEKPKRDPVKALILEYQKMNKVSGAEAAKIIGISSTAFYHLMKKVHTDDWKPRQYKILCRRLGVPIDELRAATTYTTL